MIFYVHDDRYVYSCIKLNLCTFKIYTIAYLYKLFRVLFIFILTTDFFRWLESHKGCLSFLSYQ